MNNTSSILGPFSELENFRVKKVDVLPLLLLWVVSPNKTHNLLYYYICTGPFVRYLH